MYFVYGSHVHAANEVNLVTLNVEPVFNSRGIHQSTRKTMTLRVEMIASSQSAIRTAIQAFEAAYQQGRGSAGLYHDDGSASPHYLDGPSSLGGIQVSYTYDRSDGAEYATGRTATVTLTAEYPNNSADANIVAWQETLTLIGTGGPRRVVVEVLTGKPRRQTVNRSTACYAQQSGSAIGYRSYLSPPAPMFPDSEIEDRRQIEWGSAQRQRDEFLNWPVSWNYSFASPSPLIGRPRSI